MAKDIVLSSGQVISGEDPNYAEYAAQQTGASTNAADTTNSPAALADVKTVDLYEAQNQANTAFSGIVSPMTLSDIRAREEAAKTSTAQTANATYDPAISREKQTGATQVSSAEGAVGQRQGFNLSTAELAFVGDIQNKVQDRIKEVENTKAAYISAGNLAAADKADAQIQSLNEFNTNMAIAKANYALQIMSGSREEAQLTLSKQQSDASIAQAKATADLQAENLKLDAYQVALKTPVGKSFEVNGVTYTGMNDLSGVDPTNITVSTDDKGYETGIDKTTGKILWKSDKPTGKTKTQAANVTLNLNAAQSAGLNTAVTALNSTVGPDGYYNTSDVISQLQAYSIANPGKTQSFLDTVLPKVNPAAIPTITGAIQKKTAEQEALDLINAM